MALVIAAPDGGGRAWKDKIRLLFPVVDRFNVSCNNGVMPVPPPPPPPSLPAPSKTPSLTTIVAAPVEEEVVEEVVVEREY